MIGFKKIVASAIVATVCLSVAEPVFAQTMENQTANTAEQTIFEIPAENTESPEEEPVVVDITGLASEEVAQKETKKEQKKEPRVVKEKKTKKVVKKQSTKKNLGKFTVYAYSGGGITASGTRTKANRTVAVDPKVIPLGSKLMINGKTYVAEDTGGFIKGKKLDIYIPSERECLKWGRRELNVYLVK